MDFYFDWFFDLINDGSNYDSSGITVADREAYVKAYSGPGALSAALGWFRAFGRDIEDNEEWFAEPLNVPYLAMVEPRIRDAMKTQASRIARNPELVEISPSGHWITQQQPAQVARALISFLRE